SGCLSINRHLETRKNSRDYNQLYRDQRFHSCTLDSLPIVKYSSENLLRKCTNSAKRNWKDTRRSDQSLISSLSMPTAAVIVVGDIGRSPRTANHALSLAEEKDYDVCLIGYSESALNERIVNHPKISVIPLLSPPSLPSFVPQLLCLLWRFGWTFITLFITLLFRIGWSVNIILVQNPPALPALIVAWMISRVRNARFVIDWHNYTWSMLGERWRIREEELGLVMNEDSNEVKKEKEERRVKGGKATYIRLTHYLEGSLGRSSDSSLCVSSAMADDLRKRWNITARVFYDRPPNWKFGTVSLSTKHSLFRSLGEKSVKEGNEEIANMLMGGGGEDNQDTFFSRENKSGDVSLREDRPLIVISSTSWTPDEDFSILLDAVAKYDERVKIEKNKLPHLFLIITGKGPEKAYYMDKINQLDLSHVSFYSPWLEAADYPTAVATADIGVCLHTSTSGVDLPMKVVDMFGCGVPVLAKRFPAIGELVKEKENGYLFDTHDDLVDLLVKMARGHPEENKELHKLQAHVKSSKGRLRSWEETWGEATKEAFRDEKNKEKRLE
ncbi:algn-1, partial [Pristionchus pacificus]|uniref:Beta-1,4-mannosyltransferase n=1 Tax=Pristionchus pacificus TaxID=54126 RepID=A0A8R1V4Y2_PRIPA